MNGAKDLFGRALWDYVRGQGRDMITWTSLTPPEILRTAYLFRTYDQMPGHERMALQLARGRILDIGAGSGSHTLWLQEQGADVYAVDASRLACRTMERRGVRRRLWADVFRYKPGRRFDTLLMLMNGAGMAGRRSEGARLFELWMRLLAPGGQVLVHTSDIAYVYAAYDLAFPADSYYGDVRFYLKYGRQCTVFDWVYWAPGDLLADARAFGFHGQTLYRDEWGDALLRFTR